MNYKLTLKTGSLSGSGTDADVSILFLDHY